MFRNFGQKSSGINKNFFFLAYKYSKRNKESEKKRSKYVSAVSVVTRDRVESFISRLRNTHTTKTLTILYRYFFFSVLQDPGGVQSKPLKVNKSLDLVKVIIKAVRELGERDGSNLKSIEKYVRQSHSVEEEQDGDLKAALRLSTKRAVDRGLVVQDGRLFRQADKIGHIPKKLNVSSDQHSDSNNVPKVRILFHIRVRNPLDSR